MLDRRQLDLLNWEPPQPVARFADTSVRAATFEATISRAVATALRDCEDSRDSIVKKMAAFLDQRVPKSMLDAYASQAREDHAITVPRFIALIHATGDFRLLQLLADQFGLAVVEKHYLPKIEEALIAEQIDKLERRRRTLRKAGP